MHEIDEQMLKDIKEKESTEQDQNKDQGVKE